MSTPANVLAQEIERRAGELFAEQQQRIHSHTDRVFAWVMVFQWFLGIAFALWISPKTWEGAVGSTHVHVWAALFLGGAITAFPVALALLRPGAEGTRHAIAAGQMLTSALLIHLTGGRIETHFHVFGSLAFLAFYRDWRVLITASTVVVIDHFVRGVFWPQSVYGVLSAPAWRVGEHTAWVLFEDVVLMASSRESRREMRAIAERQARLEAVNTEVEGKVRERTAELQAREQHFRALVEKSADGVFLVTPAASIAYASDSAARLLGWSALELQGRGYFDSVHPDDQERLRDLFDRCVAAPGGREVKAEYRVAGRSGAWLEMESVSVNHLWDPAVGAVVVNFRDVSARKRAEEAVDGQRRFLRQVIDVNPNFIFVKDREGRFTLVNEAVAQAYGTTVEDLVGRKDSDFSANEAEVEAFRRDDLAVLDSLQERVIPEETLTDAKGRQRFLQTVKRPIVSADGIARHVVGVATDVTDRKRTEEALRQSLKMEAVGRLAGGIAHDFNNHLTVISGFSKLILRDLEPGDPRTGRLEQISRASDRAAALTAQLLAFTRKQVLQPKVLDLNSTLREMETMLRRLIGEDIDLRTFLEPKLGRVRADPGQIGQVILNLAVNARDAMPTGGRLTIETANVHSNGGRPSVRVTVTDTGHGMDAATQARIFEPFFTTKEPGKGTGLGLATVYGIVEQSEGHITVISEPGLGTTFHIQLPLVTDAAERATLSPTPKAAREGTEAVLLVEDDDDVRAFAREVLVERGYTVLAARSGADALQMCVSPERVIHLLLTDMVMPGMSGPQLAERLTSRRAGLPVLYMSGYAEGVLMKHGIPHPEAPLLPKPFTPWDLARAVRRVLDGVLETDDGGPSPALEVPPHAE